ncbi:Altered inheritance of mitochondria protein 24, mitochondrial {ECO:0000256/RuleBase:RU363045} [Serendipita indica DSM 11827]|nr:Altered inheritance of mitochondria protein 24, mitochondrial {ECO:0000256/RuleBase:RU363045} [Serendipita indica DSM 11827]
MSYGPPSGPPGAPPPGFHPGSGYPGGPPPGWAGPPAQMGPPPVMSPPPGQGPGGPVLATSSVVADTTGVYEGAQYRIDHRDSNSILQITLQQGYQIKSRPGAMVAMSASVQIKGSMKISLSKMITGGEMSESKYTGPGEVILAPEVWGDIVPIQIQPNTSWSVGKDAYLACTANVTRSTKSQGFMKGLMSGEGFFVARVEGQGVLFVQSLGAIVRRDLRPGEEWIVDNGHLVAWSASYTMERIQTTGGGFLSGSHTGEGAGVLVPCICKRETLRVWDSGSRLKFHDRARGGGGGGSGFGDFGF